MAIVTDPAGYQPQINNEVLGQLFYTVKTIDFGLAKLYPNIKRSVQLPKIVVSDSGLRPFDCLTNSLAIASDTTFVTLTVCDADLSQDLCKSAINPVFDSMGIFESAPGIFTYPAEYLSIIIDEILKKLKQDLDQLMWLGDSATPVVGYPWLEVCDGFLKLIAAETYAPTTVSSPIALTPSNIIDELGRMYLVIPDEVKERAMTVRDVYIAVSPLTYSKAMLAHGSTLNQNAPALAMMDYTPPEAGVQTVLGFLGIPLIPTLGLKRPSPANDNLMICSFMENMLVGTDAFSEFSNIMVFDGTQHAQPKVIMLRGGTRIGMQYLWREYITTYGL
jgi:hypothetical protein